MLDDLLVGEDGLVPWGKEAPTHALMGRFGNVFLTNGEPAWRGKARPGEVVRYYFTNASNTRTFNLSFPGARMKVVGSDLGAFTRESWVESVVIGPAERYVVQVRFDRPGRVALVNRVRGIDHWFGRYISETDTLGVVQVGGAAAPAIAGFGTLRADTATAREIREATAGAESLPSRELLLTMEANLPVFCGPPDAEGLGLLQSGRVERDHARDELGGHDEHGALVPEGPRHRPRGHGDRLAFQGR